MTWEAQILCPDGWYFLATPEPLTRDEAIECVNGWRVRGCRYRIVQAPHWSTL